MKHKKSIWTIYLIYIFLIAMFASSFTVIVQYYKTAKQTALNDHIKMLYNQYNIITAAYSDMADLIYSTSINNNEIKKLFADGIKSSDAEEQNGLRNLLYSQLSDLYTEIIGFNFRQLHFHDKDNKSYLRFHRPEKYGDDLTGIRYSVEYVNNEKVSISGFEEGRIFNGYRNVYPLSYNNEHIGSVEISISIKTIIEQIHKVFNQQAQFILLQSQVEEKVFKSEASNYIQWKIDSRYVLDKGISENCILEGKLTEKETIRIRNLIKKFSATGSPLSTEIKYEQIKTILTLIPVRNFLNEDVAYLISLSKDNKLEEINRSLLIISVIYISLFILVTILTFYYGASRSKIEELMKIDFLTKADCRRVLMEKIADENKRFNRYKRPFSIIMIDIDHFKRINDNYGHLKGDEVLKNMSALIQQHLRGTDSFGRCGGEEFIILLPETNLTEASTVAESLRKIVEKHQFIDSEVITISMGVSEIFDGLHDIDELIEKTDKNLYKAKNTGRNRVCY